MKKIQCRDFQISGCKIQKFYILLLLMFTYIDKSKSYMVCSNPACTKAANNLTDFMDTSVDICSSIYNRVCGKFHIKHPLPDTKPMISPFHFLEVNLQQNLETLLKSPQSSNTTQAFRHAQTIYQQCMNTDEINKRGAKPILKWLKRQGGWPLITRSTEAYDKNPLLWLELLITVQRNVNRAAILYINPYINDDDSTSSTLEIGVPYLIFSKETILSNSDLNKKKKETIKTYIHDLAAYLAKSSNLNVPEDVLQKGVDEIMDFTVKLAEVLPSSLDSIDLAGTRKATPIEEYQKKFDSYGLRSNWMKINWLRLIKRRYKYTNITIDSSEPLKEEDEQVMKKLYTLLDNTPVVVIVNYIIWTFLWQTAEYADENVTNIRSKFLIDIYGVKKTSPRATYCLKIHNNLMKAISYEYTKRYYKSQSTDKVKEMVNDIKKVLKSNIESASWMDAETKEKSIAKLMAIKDFIGYPEYYTDQYIDDFYSANKFNISSDYFTNMLNLAKINSNGNLIELRKKVDKNEWSMNLLVTAAVLQYPFYDPDLPESMNYGGIGMIIGHEMAHAFDNSGRKFDLNGNVVQWWSNATIEAYNKQTGCFIKQFENPFYIAHANINVTVNANLTLVENLADSGGILAAYKAFQKKKAECLLPDIRLPGYESLDDNKLFFINYAESMCYSSNTNALEDSALSNEHAPPDVRVDMSVANTEPFATAFNCASGTRMNPTRKCNLWH